MKINVIDMLTSQDTRTYVVGELYETEKSYVESLQILVEKYMKPLKNLDNRSLIDSALVDEIFYTIPEILEHHERFLQALQDRISSDWDSSQVIGNVFIEAFTNQQIIDTYTAFINNWKNARQAIKTATQAKPAFERFLETMSREHRNKLTLDALLIMPVQRIPRYELLIKELIKHTPEDHSDHGPLIEAQKEIHELALKIDQAEKEMIHQEQLKELESLIDGHIELQHPQRIFVRYDLVTILGPSSLTIAKKERVIFLFCDLLIMTSVKKKASRRTNLHNAFTNSYNDISLLEGNKFKLLLRAMLDQVDVRVTNEKTLSQQQQSEEQDSANRIAQKNKLMQEKKLQVESDLSILHQIELLSSKLTLIDRSRICEINDELSNQLRLVMRDLEQCDSQVFSSQTSNVPSATNTNLSCADIPTRTPIAQPSSNSALLTPAQTIVPQTTLTPVSAAQDSNVSLELIISNSSSYDKELNQGSSSTTSDTIPCDQSQMMDSYTSFNTSSQPSTNAETLVVTFTSTDRRRAFLQAFIEAKQNRYKIQKQQKYQQQQKIFSSSLTLRLAQPGSSSQRSFSYDPRGKKELQHQDTSDAKSTLNAHIIRPQQKSHSNLSNAARVFSAPTSKHGGSNMMVHQMSAPQPLISSTLENSSRCDLSQNNCCAKLSSDQSSSHAYHHHHQQLMHQPASHPASLDTICCHELHENQIYASSRDNRSEKSIDLNNFTESQDTNNNDDFVRVDMKQQQVDNAERTIFSSSGPRFFTSMPVNFLTTQHPALQFTCLASHLNLNQPRPIQTFRQLGAGDGSDKVWLCLSNGYVSHVVLIELKRNLVKTKQEVSACSNDGLKISGCSYEIVPIIRSAGDICKAHINCATRVRILGPRNQVSGGLEMTKVGENLSSVVEVKNVEALRVEVAIKAASPPIQVKDRNNLLSKCSGSHLSESAPSHTGPEDERVIKLKVPLKTSSSTPRLELHRATCKHSGPRSTSTEHNRTSDEIRSNHDVICHRHYHHSREGVQQRLKSTMCTRNSGPLNNNAQRRDRLSDSGGSSGQLYSRDHHLYHHTAHSHSHQHINQGHQPYSLRHHTVPLGELRRALERQSKISEQGQHHNPPKIRHLAPPANTPDSLSISPSDRQLHSLDLAAHGIKIPDCEPERRIRSATPPAGYNGMKSFKSARSLRHQASLKTSSILAKIVGNKRYSYLRKSGDKQASDVEDNELDAEKNKADSISARVKPADAESSSSDKNISGTGNLRADRCLLGSRENTVVSPLSSVSSLNSTNSSLAVNSVCTSSPNRSYLNLPADPSSVYRNDPIFISSSCLASTSDQGIRERSATVPSRAVSMLAYTNDEICPGPRSKSSCSHVGDSYRVSEIIETSADDAPEYSASDEAKLDSLSSSLWFGCDDGTIILINCLSGDQKGSGCNLCDPNIKSLGCNNLHSEIKLGAAVSDIRNFNDERVYVALTNGQLAIFSQEDQDCDTETANYGWSLTSPNILSITDNELNSTSKLCLIDETHLWYSYGRNIFVLNTQTLSSETTIKVPANDVSLQMAMQSIMIDGMELVGSLNGVWTSFRNSHMIQFYDVKTHKLLIELNLFDPINKVLSYGNEILRQHKTACLKATSLLSYENKSTKSTTIFIGTSAGIILYLDINREQLHHWSAQDEPSKEWQPQVASLRHGHSGHVKFLHLVHMKEDKKDQDSKTGENNRDRNNLESYLVSGGTGLDFYGPNDGQQNFYRLNAEEDYLNHMLLWKL